MFLCCSQRVGVSVRSRPLRCTDPSVPIRPDLLSGVKIRRRERRHWRAAGVATKALQKTQRPTCVPPRGDAARQKLGDGDRVEHRDVTPSSKSASKLERFSAAQEFVKVISSA